MFPSISLTGLFGSISTELGDLFTEAGGSLVGVGQHPAAAVRGRAPERERRADQGGSRAAQGRVCADRAVGVPRSARCLAGPGADRRRARTRTQQQVAALARATELAELRYAQGDIAYIDLLDVRRGLFQAQIDLVAAQRDALLNTVDLALAVGGGLGDKAEPLSAKR